MNNIKNPLPGDHKEQELLHSIIRVNHAGEYGAKRIYEGQLAILKNHPSALLIKHMKEQELEHLTFFEQELIKHRIRPSILHPFWHAAGFALGAITALIGDKAAMACTSAVETVITEHYNKQINLLTNQNAELKQKITKFRDDELEHKNTALEQGATLSPLYTSLNFIIQQGCRAAIFLAKRF
ncbi:2-nonaprenyl-3-methyl-6-methoxy-1,4-benzoquinol hydroxylase [Rickettsiales bacterium Ac37b]|nr:2-nonaprenyl-3-methyl-6-methoxy-1,4-benzoquinol hydroxylase [Rickettsiales bacterium Ac37b]